MKTLIIYASKTGTTKKCADILAKELGDCTITDIHKVKKISLDEYDAVVFGSYIHAGKLDKKLKNYALTHLTDVRAKKVGFFVTGSGYNSALGAYKSNLSAEFISKCRSCVYGGGEYNLDNAKGITKILLKILIRAAAEKGVSLPEIIPENLLSLAQELKEN